MEPSPEEIAEGYREFQGEGLASWHFPMMNDVVRNAAYETALAAALKNAGKSGRVVLDIGTGSGLLAMMAARHGATRVITCEELREVATKAQEIIKQNGFADQIQVINKLSNQLVVGRDIPEKVDVLVTETFDYALLGEYAFATYRHAVRELLKPDGQIIPARARVFAMCIESQEIFENHRVSQASGFDLSAFNELSGKIYTGYHLDKMKYRALSAPTEVFAFDFKNIPGDQALPREFAVTQSGVCHAVAFWFELQMDEKTTLTTAPHLKQLSCWKQAVQLLEQPVQVNEGTALKLLAHHNSEEIWFTRS